MRSCILFSLLLVSPAFAQAPAGGLPPPPEAPTLFPGAPATPAAPAVPVAPPARALATPIPAMPAATPIRPAGTPFAGFGQGTRPGMTPVPALPVPGTTPAVPNTPAPAAEEEEENVTNEPNVLSDSEKALGWKLLFDGQKLLGLRGMRHADPLKGGWVVEKGVLKAPKTIAQTGKVTGGDLVSAEAFDHFEFKFDFQLAVSANSGILYLARGGVGQKPVGAEFQLIDDASNPESLRGGPAFRTGALLGVIPPTEMRLKKPVDISDEIPWNRGKLVVQGNHVEHWLNGTKVLAYDLGSRDLANLIRTSKAKPPAGFGLKFKSPILILDQGEEVGFRNLKVRLLPPTPTTPATTAPATKP